MTPTAAVSGASTPERSTGPRPAAPEGTGACSPRVGRHQGHRAGAVPQRPGSGRASSWGVDRAVDTAIEREIRALAEELGVVVVVATRKVASAWFDDALAQGVSPFAADEVRRYVHLVGSGIPRSEPEGLRHHPR